MWTQDSSIIFSSFFFFGSEFLELFVVLFFSNLVWYIVCIPWFQFGFRLRCDFCCVLVVPLRAVLFFQLMTVVGYSSLYVVLACWFRLVNVISANWFHSWIVLDGFAMVSVIGLTVVAAIGLTMVSACWFPCGFSNWFHCGFACWFHLLVS